MATTVSSRSSDVLDSPEQHPLTAASCNLKILKSQKHCDVSFIVGQEQREIKCHKIFLVARSPVFEAEFSERWTIGGSENSGGVIEVLLPNENPQIFQSFIEYMYADQFNEELTSVLDLLPLAHYYDVVPLVEKCESLLYKEYTNLVNTLEIYKVSVKYSLTKLMEKVELFLARYFGTLIGDPIFETIDENSLIRLLMRNDLMVEEVQIFEAIRRWASVQKQCDPLLRDKGERDILKNLVPLIRFPIMSLEQFASRVSAVGLLTDGEVIKLFQYFSLYAKAKSSNLPALFPRELRGVERTLELYQPTPRGCERFTSEFAVSASPKVYTDRLSFVFESRRCQPHRKLMITEFLVRCPSVEIFRRDALENIQIPVRREESRIKISIKRKGRSSRGVFETICALTTKIQPGENMRLSIPTENLVQLKHNNTYGISVEIDSCLPVTGLHEYTQVDSSLDLASRTSLQGKVSDSSEIGSFDLKNMKMVTMPCHFVQQHEGPRVLQTYALHVVRAMKVAYF